jgi:hypothetical protein
MRETNMLQGRSKNSEEVKSNLFVEEKANAAHNSKAG